jgi:hypothetical protein
MEKLSFLPALLLAGCAARGMAPNPKYPPRPAGCKLAVIFDATPPVPWDDLGVAEVACHINTGQPQCIGQLRTQACRMGGDILYDVPRSPLRPRDEVLLFRGHVAHSRAPDAGAKSAKPQDKEEEPPPESGPVVPIGSSPPPAPDAGPG